MFAKVTLQQTIRYILEEKYVKKKVPKKCLNPVFGRLLLKLTTENTFMLISQVTNKRMVAQWADPFL